MIALKSLGIILLVFIHINDSLKLNMKSMNRIKELKNDLFFLTSKTISTNGIDASIEQRDDINKCVENLKKLNPTKRPAYASSLLKGKWRLTYTDISIAPSNGKIGPFIGKVYQDLCPATSKITKDGYVKNILDLSLINGELCAIQSIYDDNTWRIDFDYVENKLLGIPFQKKEFPAIGEEGSQTRLWKLIYLDEDLRILRAGILPNNSNPKSKNEQQEDFLFITIKE